MYQVIIADDDQWIREGLTKVVQWNSLGFEVAASVASGKEALEYLKSHTADVILTDINMPEMTGLELILEAKKCCPSLKSVIISGYSEFEYAKSAIDLKVESYLLKPLSPAEISNVFASIKKTLDGMKEAGADESSRKIKREYELMQILNQKASSTLDFGRLAGNEKYCELVFIKLFEAISTNAYEESMDGCVQAVKMILNDYFYCALGHLFVALVRPGLLGNLIFSLEERLAGFPQVTHRISIGKEVYSKSEIVSSYWSAVELVRESEKSNIVHYSREHSRFKKDWYALLDLSQKLFHEIEVSQPLRVEELTAAIVEILGSYEINDARHSFMDVLERALAYFKIKPEPRFILLTDEARTDDYEGTFAELVQLFQRDIKELMDTVRQASDSMSRLIVNQALQAIRDSYKDKSLSLASLANKLGVSYGYLSTIFVKNTGKSFKTCLVEVRMEAARELLISRKYKIYEIADMVGYSSPRYFTDAFKKFFGISPLDYIARLRGDS